MVRTPQGERDLGARLGRGGSGIHRAIGPPPKEATERFEARLSARSRQLRNRVRDALNRVIRARTVNEMSCIAGSLSPVLTAFVNCMRACAPWRSRCGRRQQTALSTVTSNFSARRSRPGSRPSTKRTLRTVPAGITICGPAGAGLGVSVRETGFGAYVRMRGVWKTHRVDRRGAVLTGLASSQHLRLGGTTHRAKPWRQCLRVSDRPWAKRWNGTHTHRAIRSTLAMDPTGFFIDPMPNYLTMRAIWQGFTSRPHLAMVGRQQGDSEAAWLAPRLIRARSRGYC